MIVRRNRQRNLRSARVAGAASDLLVAGFALFGIAIFLGLYKVRSSSR